MKLSDCQYSFTSPEVLSIGLVLFKVLHQQRATLRDQHSVNTTQDYVSRTQRNNGMRIACYSIVALHWMRFFHFAFFRWPQIVFGASDLCVAKSPFM